MKKGDYPEPKEDYGKKTSYYVLNYLNQDPSRTIRLVRKDDGQIYEVHPKGEEPIKNVWFERRFTEDELQRIEEVHGKLDSIPSDTFEANTDDLVDMIRGKNWKLDDTKFHLWMEERGMV